jgi:hypothetical protein
MSVDCKGFQKYSLILDAKLDFKNGPYGKLRTLLIWHEDSIIKLFSRSTLPSQFLQSIGLHQNIILGQQQSSYLGQFPHRRTMSIGNNSSKFIQGIVQIVHSSSFPKKEGLTYWFKNYQTGSYLALIFNRTAFPCLFFCFPLDISPIPLGPGCSMDAIAFSGLILGLFSSVETWWDDEAEAWGCA